MRTIWRSNYDNYDNNFPFIFSNLRGLNTAKNFKIYIIRTGQNTYEIVLHLIVIDNNIAFKKCNIILWVF